jgi:hypothetical protein
MAGDLEQLLSFIANISDDLDYGLEVDRPDAVMVEIATPGIRWEIQFMTSGAIEVEKFLTDGTIYRPARVEDLINEIKQALV